MSWPQPAVGGLCDSTELCDPTQKPDKSFVYIDISSVDKERKRIVSAEELIGRNAPSRARKRVKVSDILVSTVRPNLNSVAEVPKELDGQVASTGFCVLRARPEVLVPRFLFYWTLTPTFIHYLTARMRGANYPAVTDDTVRGAVIPLPPPSEQRCIVEVLDQADSLRWQRVAARQKTERIPPALFHRMFGNPQGWQDDAGAPSLGELVHVTGGATPSTQHPEYWDGPIPWVSPKDMKCDLLRSSQDRISELALQETNLSLIPPGAVLIVVRGMILAHTVPVAIAGVPLTINQDMKALAPRDGRITSAYLDSALRALHPRLLSLVRTAAHGTRKLDMADLLSLRIAIPDPGKLGAFTRWQDECRRVADHISTSRDKLNQVFTVLLHRAFSGTLTAKWREAHMKELVQEMEAQTQALRSAEADAPQAPESVSLSPSAPLARKQRR